MNVVLCSPALTYQADAPYSTRMRANAMAGQGFKVTVVGFPEAYQTDLGPCHFDYLGLTAALTPAKRQKWLAWKKKSGLYWTYAIEPWLVMRAAFAQARKTDAVLYVANVEPWIFLIMAWCNRWSRRPIPLVTMIPYMFAMAASGSFSAKVRGWLNDTSARWLPRYCELICDNRHVAEVLKLDRYSSVRVIPEAFREITTAPSQAEARAALGIPPGRRMLLLFGVAGHAKGSDLLFSALEGVSPAFMLYIVGQTGGVYQDSWGQVEALKQKGWGDNLQVVSRFVSEQEMEQFFCACDAVVLPYRHGYVTTSGNFMKAIEYSKAIIVSDQYYIGEVVREHRLGLVFPPEDVPALRQRLIEFGEKPDAWFADIRQNAARLVQEQSWPNIGLMYRRLFEKMTAAAKSKT
jgi:glycosyltransferase involved in cell wall biosynthesis